MTTDPCTCSADYLCAFHGTTDGTPGLFPDHVKLAVQKVIDRADESARVWGALLGGGEGSGDTVTYARVPDPMSFRGVQEYTDTTAAYERGEDVIPGDCWRACLASLLEVPLAEVPHFIHLYPHRDLRHDELLERERREKYGPLWWVMSIAWVEQQRPGWTLRAYEPVESVWEQAGQSYYQGAPDRLILTGKSPRGDWNHSALYDARTGELEHDPFPGGEGVLEPRTDLVLLVRKEWL